MHSSILLDALAPRMKANKIVLPCEIVRHIVLHKPTSRFPRESVDQALVLVGIYYQLSHAILSDPWGLEIYEPSTRHWKRRRQPRYQHVWAEDLELSLDYTSSRDIRLPVATREFLRAFSLALARDMVQWAPPVVELPSDPDDPMQVRENLFSAFIVGQVFPSAGIWVRVLRTQQEARFTLLDMARFAEPLLRPIFWEHRNRIWRLAPKVEVAFALGANAERIRHLNPKE